MLEVTVVLVVFGLVALLLGMSRWLAARPWAAAGNLVVGLVLLGIAHRWWPAAKDLQSYEHLPPRRALVAQVYCEREGPQAFRVTLTRMPTGRMQVFEMVGDAWRLAARTLEWKGHAAQIGLSPGYRLDRLTARTGPTDAAAPAAAATPMDARSPNQVPTGYRLHDEATSGEDVWAQVRTGARWEIQADARLVSGPWRQLADGARYDVWLTLGPRGAHANMVVEPGNEAAAKAMGYTTKKKVRTPGRESG
jgi:hypothetical protein